MLEVNQMLNMLFPAMALHRRIAPPMNGPEGVTDLKIIHVPIDVGVGKTGVVLYAG